MKYNVKKELCSTFGYSYTIKRIKLKSMKSILKLHERKIIVSILVGIKAIPNYSLTANVSSHTQSQIELKIILKHIKITLDEKSRSFNSL
jgi:hypothetical protein